MSAFRWFDTKAALERVQAAKLAKPAKAGATFAALATFAAAPRPLCVSDGRKLWRLPAPVATVGATAEALSLMQRVRDAGAVLVADGRTLIVCGRTVAEADLCLLAQHSGVVVAVLLGESRRRCWPA